MKYPIYEQIQAGKAKISIAGKVGYRMWQQGNWVVCSSDWCAAKFRIQR